MHLQYLYAEDKLGLYVYLYLYLYLCAEEKLGGLYVYLYLYAEDKLGLYLYLYAELLKIMNVQSLTVATDRQDTDFER